MSDAAKGIVALVFACTIWGLSPLYYALLTELPPLEVLCYRTLWSLLLFAMVLAAQRRLRQLTGALSSARAVAVIAMASLMISANWFGYIFAIGQGRTVEASLGYFVFPLVAVVFGAVIFGERLGRLQWIAVVLAACAVVLLTWGLGVPPRIALMLAVTFAFYGVIKKTLPLGPVVSVTAEVAILAPLALLWLVRADHFDLGWQLHVLLALSGLMTAVPLMLFSYAARRVSMSSIGLVQYLNPSLQFICATLIFGELFTGWHAIAFPIIWVALAIYSYAALREEKAVRRASSSVGTSGTTVM